MFNKYRKYEESMITVCKKQNKTADFYSLCMIFSNVFSTELRLAAISIIQCLYENEVNVPEYKC